MGGTHSNSPNWTDIRMPTLMRADARSGRLRIVATFFSLRCVHASWKRHEG